MRTEPDFERTRDVGQTRGRHDPLTSVGAGRSSPSPVTLLKRAGQLSAAIITIAALSLLAREGRPGPVDPSIESQIGSPFVPTVARAARPAIPVALSEPRFRLDDPDALEAPRAETARLNPATGRREDVLVQGGFDIIEAPYLRLTLTGTPEPETGPRLFVTLARRAADGQGLAVIRTGEHGTIATKFGVVETLDLTLGGEGRRNCTGFATLEPGALRLDGWLCAPLGQAPEPRAVACALDRISLNGQPSSALESTFATTEARRDPGCGPRVVAMKNADRDVGGETGSIPARRPRKAPDTKK